MYRLLVVDDERYIVNWLYDLFEEHFENTKQDVEIVKAYTSQDALKMATEMRFDIIVSDICMPGMDGFELVNAVKKNWEHIKIIFLSAYDEFDYVYRSVKYDNVRYILKTEDDEEIISAVENMLDELRQEEADAVKLSVQTNMLKLLQQREFLRQLFSESIPLSLVTTQKLQEYNIHLDVERPTKLLFMKITSFILPESKEPFGMANQIDILMQYYFGQKLNCVQYDYKEGYYLWLLQWKDLPDAEAGSEEQWKKFIMQTLEAVHNAISQKLKLRVSFLYYSPFVPWEHLLHVFFKFEKNLDFFLGQENGLILVRDSLEVPKGSIDSKLDLENQKHLLPQKISSALRRGNRSEVTAILEQTERNLLSCSIHDLNVCELYLAISECFLSFINDTRLASHVAFKIGLYNLGNIHDFNSWKSAIDYLKDLNKAIFDILEQEKQDRQDNTVAEVLSYIDNNLNGDLSLTRIAEYVNYNPSYLSRLFKQTTHQNLYQYITTLRLTRAAELLEYSNQPVSAVAKEIGFDSAQYFATVFKKFYNQTPQEYRNNRISKKN